MNFKVNILTVVCLKINNMATLLDDSRFFIFSIYTGIIVSLYIVIEFVIIAFKFIVVFL